MSFVYLTSTSVRHKAFVRQLGNLFPPSLVIREPKKKINNIDSEAILSYREEIETAERVFFKQTVEWEIPYPVIQTEAGDINSPDALEVLQNIQPDWLLVFGTSILTQDLLKIPRRYTLNIHTGLTQAFRGVDSAFWALHDEIPEGIGATIHIIDTKIDTGDVVIQGRPSLSVQDSLAIIFLKTVQLGFDLMETSISGLLNGKLHPKKLARRGKLYQTKDLSHAAIHNVLSKKNAVIDLYLANKTERDSHIKLIY